MPSAENNRPHLRLLPTKRPQPNRGSHPLGGDPPVATTIAVAPPPLRRPGDHLELVTIDTAPMAKIRRAATSLGLHPETAIVLYFERTLVLARLHTANHQLREQLERASREAQVDVALWEPHSEYLQHLLGQRPTSGGGRELASPRVAVPVRLLDRLTALEFPTDLEVDAELKAAVRWEIASLLAGETMSEWAYRTALSGVPA